MCVSVCVCIICKYIHIFLKSTEVPWRKYEEQRIFISRKEQRRSSRVKAMEKEEYRAPAL